MEIAPWLEQVEIRSLRAQDLTALEWDGEYAHFRRVYAEAYSRAQLGKSVLWVADLPTPGIIGQCFIQLICDRPELADGETRAYLYAFRIRPFYRGGGLGTRMLLQIENDLLSRGFQFVTLNVARTNVRARVLYEHNGYQVVAPEPGIWSYIDENGRWRSVQEPAWRMEKQLAGRNSDGDSAPSDSWVADF